jgi:CheY-like chemotaxis protein
MFDANKARILLVDDDPDVLTLTLRAFAPDGYQVLTAQSGVAALAMLREQRPSGLVPAQPVNCFGDPVALASGAQLGAVCVIETPREMADEENHPCTQAFVFRFEAPTR